MCSVQKLTLAWSSVEFLQDTTVRVEVQSVSDVTTGQMGKGLRESRLVSLLSRRASTRELSGSQFSPLNPTLYVHRASMGVPGGC